MAVDLSNAIEQFVSMVDVLRSNGILCEEIEQMLTRVNALRNGNHTLAEKTAIEAIGLLNNKRWVAEHSRTVDQSELQQRFSRQASPGQDGSTYRPINEHKPRKRKLTRTQIRARNAAGRKSTEQSEKQPGKKQTKQNGGKATGKKPR